MNIEVCKKCLGGEVYAEILTRFYNLDTGSIDDHSLRSGKLRIMINQRQAYGNYCIVQVEPVDVPISKSFDDRQSFDIMRINDTNCRHLLDHMVYDCKLESECEH